MKVNRNGQSKCLTKKQLDLLVEELPPGTHTVLAMVLRKTAARVSEGRSLVWSCISENSILFPKGICKGKLKSREVPIGPELYLILKAWRIKWSEINSRKAEPNDFVFPGRFSDKPITSRAFDLALRAAAERLNLQGVSTHSFRRSALSSSSNAGTPLRHLQELSGHSNLGTLQKYLEVDEQSKRKAAMSFA